MSSQHTPEVKMPKIQRNIRNPKKGMIKDCGYNATCIQCNISSKFYPKKKAADRWLRMHNKFKHPNKVCITSKNINQYVIDGEKNNNNIIKVGLIGKDEIPEVEKTLKISKTRRNKIARKWNIERLEENKKVENEKKTKNN